MTNRPILLDTCALIFIAEERLHASGVAALDQAHRSGSAVYVSPVSAWEIGQLVSRGRVSAVVSASKWFAQALSLPGLELARLPAETLIASSFLPGKPLRDPADRIIVAAAREMAAAVMTRDRAILAYAAEGHVAAIPC